VPAEYNPFLSKKVKKSEFFSHYPLDFFPENSIIGFTLERDGKTPERTRRKPARLPGRLKESEMCLVTAQENFLEVKNLRKTGQTI
jgi:hypothetical protein